MKQYGWAQRLSHLVKQARERQILYPITSSGILKKKNNAIEFMYKQDRLTDRENKLMGRRRGKDKAGCGINRYTLLYIKQTSNRIYCVAQGVIFNIL